jgi:hypothetical protein
VFFQMSAGPHQRNVYVLFVTELSICLLQSFILMSGFLQCGLLSGLNLLLLTSVWNCNSSLSDGNILFEMFIGIFIGVLSFRGR